MFQNKPNILIVTPAKLYEFSTSQTEFSEFSEFSGTKKLSHSFTHFESHSPCKSQENCLVQSIVLGIIFRICKLFWLVVLTILKNISQWEGLSHLLWKNVWNHQPVFKSVIASSSQIRCFLLLLIPLSSLSPTQKPRAPDIGDRTPDEKTTAGRFFFWVLGLGQNVLVGGAITILKNMCSPIARIIHAYYVPISYKYIMVTIVWNPPVITITNLEKCSKPPTSVGFIWVS